VSQPVADVQKDRFVMRKVKEGCGDGMMRGEGRIWHVSWWCVCVVMTVIAVLT